MKRLALSVIAAFLVAPPIGSSAETAANDAVRCHSFKGRDAVIACLAAIKADPASKRLRRRLGFAYLEADLFSESIKALREVTTRWPNDWQGQFDLASVYGFLQAYPSAVAPIEAAMRIEPNNLQSLMLATIIFRNVRRDETVFRIALKAAGLGERVAMFMTSYHYEYGVGTGKDLASARYWMEKAAAAGHVAAMDQMTRGYLNGEMGFTPDARKAEIWAARARKARDLK
jgi:TPR repeat protein